MNDERRYGRVDLDWYVEPTWTTELLLRAETFEGEIVDPACGQGNINSIAMQFGYTTRGLDIEDRPKVCDFRFERRQFLDHAQPFRADNIVCNPPYGYIKGIAAAFVWRSLEVAEHKVAMLVPTKFLSSQGRFKLFTTTPLRRIYFLMSRPSMPPGDLLAKGEIKAQGGKSDYCWIVWEHGYVGEPAASFLIRPEHNSHLAECGSGDVKKT